VTTSAALDGAATLFDALGDPTRLRVFTRLCDGGPSSTSQVMQVIPVSRQAVSKHLSMLEGVGLVHSRKHGRERIWTVRTEPLVQASAYLDELSYRWDHAIERLRAFVEDPSAT
jgi:DNA-binding transcriptional ArsR family regulator